MSFSGLCYIANSESFIYVVFDIFPQVVWQACMLAIVEQIYQQLNEAVNDITNNTIVQRKMVHTVLMTTLIY